MTKKSQGQKPDFASFPIVGVGASAGGLEAFRQLLRRLPPAPGMAIVLVQHLAPEHESILAELLSRGSRMPVRQITDGMTMELNVVYVIPPNVNLAMAGKKLKLLPRTQTRGVHMPIDYFFQSLAHEHGSQVIGVILSGTASDGASGIEAIKSAGGITIVQEPKTAKFSGMPNSAIATGAADFILSVEGIAQELTEISHHPHVSPSRQVHQEEAIGPPNALDKVFSLLQLASGVDFRHYKHNTIQRRIQRRMTLHKIHNLEDYTKLLRRDGGELDALYHDILIKVSGFFREPQTFETFKRKILPALLKPNLRGTPPSPLRIWVPGCAAGEEAYSLAICLLECLGDRAASTPFQIFATDIDEKALAKARAGLYMENIATDVSPERLQAFFAKVNQHYEINRSIRDLCLFAKHNVIKDPPFSNLDLISCRNVLIYLGHAVHQKVFSLFHYALKPNGYLILGASESVGTFTDFFQPAHKKLKIYSKRSITLRPHLDFIDKEYLSEDTSRVRSQQIASEQPLREGDLIREADRVVLGHYVPAGVLVNDRMEILQFRGDTSPYLTPAPGKATFDLLKMAREGLLVELRAALLQARKGGTSVKKERVLIQHNGQSNEISINVVPLKTPQTAGRFFLVLFEELATLKPKEEKRPVNPKQAVDSERVEQLQQEQASMKQYLQAIIEQHEATNEELESANEEIVSSNEELQSTNEELETAKEELQSTNEELITVNEEIRNRNQDLAQVNNDLINVLASVKLPIIMLGRDLRIRHFTPTAETVLKLTPTDMGRPITDLRLTIEIPELAQWIHAVIETVRAKEQEVQDQAGHWYSLQIQPYKTLDNKIDGAVLVLIDIEKVRALADTRAQKERLESLSRRLMEAHEDERRSIARDLHDEIGQDLTALKLSLQNSRRKGEAASENACPQRESVSIVDRLIQQVRNLSLNLRPSLLDDLGLVATLKWWLEHQGPLVGMNVKLAADPILPRLPLDVETACFRIVQEAVNNAVKHARAQGVRITLQKHDGMLELIISDDGAGFEVPTVLADAVQGKTMGLVGMEERVRAIGGRLTIRSEPGHGTKIHAFFPLS